MEFGGHWREGGGVSVLEFLQARSVKMFMDMDIFRNHSFFSYVNTFFCSFVCMTAGLVSTNASFHYYNDVCPINTIVVY